MGKKLLKRRYIEQIAKIYIASSLVLDFGIIYRMLACKLGGGVVSKTLYAAGTILDTTVIYIISKERHLPMNVRGSGVGCN